MRRLCIARRADRVAHSVALRGMGSPGVDASIMRHHAGCPRASRDGVREVQQGRLTGVGEPLLSVRVSTEARRQDSGCRPIMVTNVYAGSWRRMRDLTPLGAINPYTIS